MADTPYPILIIEPDWVAEQEAMGSKEKFWFRRSDDDPAWLFKYPQANTGQHWAEKIAAEVAAALGILHAKVELATFQGTQGSATESFASKSSELFHGNQILAGQVLGYDPTRRFRQSDHTLSNIFSALDRIFASTEARDAKRCIAQYLVLDAVIGNTDRHHENWGILGKRTPDGWKRIVAPSFDHASSLGRELRDSAPGKSRERILREGRIGHYAEKAPGGIYWTAADARGLSPLELVRRAAGTFPDLFGRVLQQLDRLEEGHLQRIVERVPEGWMSTVARSFAVELMCYNLKQLKKLVP
jgi:hypothetical protein